MKILQAILIGNLLEEILILQIKGTYFSKEESLLKAEIYRVFRLCNLR